MQTASHTYYLVHQPAMLTQPPLQKYRAKEMELRSRFSNGEAFASGRSAEESD